MSAVIIVEPKGETAAIMVMDDGSRVWTPDKSKAAGLIGKPIPADWTQKQGEYGPQAFPPFPPREGKQGSGGGKPAWANTEEGEKYVQERMDRRTALMQAVQMSGPWQDSADDMYAWLREPLESVSAPRLGAVGGESEAVAAPTKGPGGEAAKTGRVGADTPSDGGGVDSGEASPPSPPTHAEKWSPYGKPEKCSHQLVPGIKGWLKCTKCGSAKKEAEWQ